MFRTGRQIRVTAIRAILAAALTAAVAVQAQSALAGKWRGETNGGAVLVLDLTVDGTALNGTLTRDGVSTPLSAGKVSKNTFTFSAKLGDQVEAVSGELVDDQIRVWLDRQGASTAITLTRVKTASPD